MTFIFGALNMFFVCVSWIMELYGFKALQVGIIFIVANLSGLLGCIVTSSIFKNKNTYRRNCIFYVYAALVSLCVLILGFEIKQIWLVYASAGLFGFLIFPYLTTMTDFASETAFPVGESVSGGFLLFGGQIMGVICSLLLNKYFFDGKSL